MLFFVLFVAVSAGIAAPDDLEDGQVESFVQEVFPRSVASSETSSPLVATPVSPKTLAPELARRTKLQELIIGAYGRSLMCKKNKTAAEADAICGKAMLDSLYGVCTGKNGICVQKLEFTLRQLAVFVDSPDFVEVMFGVSMLGAFASHFFEGTTFFQSVKKYVNIRQQKAVVALLYHGVSGVSAMFAMTAFDILALIAAVILLILAVRAGFWLEKKSFLALLLLLSVGVAIGACYWTFLGTGYQDVGYNPNLPRNLSLIVVHIVGHLVSIFFVLVFALFAWIVIGAVLGTFFPEQRKAYIGLTIGFAGIALIVTAYTLTMTVLHANDASWDDVVIDVSDQLIAGISFLFSSVLAVMWMLAYRLVGPEKEEMRRNAIVFFSASTMLTMAYVATFIVSLLSLLVNYDMFNLAFVVLRVVCHILTVVAILGYVGVPLVLATQSKAKPNIDNGGYVPLANEEHQVPARYQNY